MSHRRFMLTIIALFIAIVAPACTPRHYKPLGHLLRFADADPVTVMFHAPGAITLSRLYDTTTDLEVESKLHAVSLSSIEGIFSESIAGALKKNHGGIHIRGALAGSGYITTYAKDPRTNDRSGFALLMPQDDTPPPKILCKQQYWERLNQPGETPLSQNDPSPDTWLIQAPFAFAGKMKDNYLALDIEKIKKMAGIDGYLLLVSIDSIEARDHGGYQKITASFCARVINLKTGVFAFVHTYKTDAKEIESILQPSLASVKNLTTLLENNNRDLAERLLYSSDKYGEILSFQLGFIDRDQLVGNMAKTNF